MSKKNNNPLSKHIRQVLYDHEEPYVLGSWERFQQYKKRNTRIRKQKQFLAIAASILLALTSAFALMNIEFMPEEQIAGNQRTEQPEITERETPPPPAEPDNTPFSEPDIEIGTEDKHTGSELADTMSGNDETDFEEPAPGSFTRTSTPVSRKPVPKTSLAHTERLSQARMAENIAVVLQEPGANPVSRSASNKSSSAEFVQAEDIRQSFNGTRQKDVVFSVAYASVMNVHDSQTDLGSGGGFYTDWNFAKNLSVSSGVFIAQNRLKYNNGSGPGNRLTEDFNAESPSTMSTDNLVSVQLDLINLEIPLNLRYFLTDRLSVSAGISSMAFLKEQYNYNFEYEQRIQVFEGNETTGLQPASRVVTMKTTQTQSEPSLNTINWAAFYTFSVGYQQEVFKQYTASFEPFIKLPAGQVTSRGISYTAGGLQLKVSF